MAPTKSWLRTRDNLFLHDAVRHQKPLRPGYLNTHNYATATPVKPRPYNDKKQDKPLVGVRPPGSATPNARPSIPKAKAGVVAPYWRISLGIILCGSMIYSMVLPTIYH